MLNFFRGGPLDGNAYTTSTLLRRDQGPLPIEDYHWTPEVIVSEKTGASARVWTHKTLPAPQLAPGQPQHQHRQENNPMADATSATDLENRRKAAKISRKQLSDKTGLSQAVIYRVERGESKRTTDEETTTYLAGLAELESAATPS